MLQKRTKLLEETKLRIPCKLRFSAREKTNIIPAKGANKYTLTK